MSSLFRTLCSTILVIGWSAAAFFPVHADEDVPASAEQKIAFVTVERARMAEVIGRVPVSGSLVPLEEVLVYPQINGYLIETLAVDVGDAVSAGDPLTVLDKKALTVQVAQARAELARAGAAIEQAASSIDTAMANKVQADASLGRFEQLRKSGTATQATLDQAITAAQTADAQVSSTQSGLAVAKAQREQAQAQLDIAQLNLQRATLVSPVDGLISERNGQVGAIATSGGNPIYKIIRDGVVEVEAEVIETALGQLKVGNTANLEIAGVGSLGGTIRRISPTVDPATRLGTIRIETTGNPNLRTGLFAGGWVITARRDALTISTSAVLTDTAGSYVLKVENETIQKTPVVAGLIWEGRREIASGLEPNDVVVAKAGAFFADGDVIKPIFADQPAIVGDVR